MKRFFGDWEDENLYGMDPGDGGCMDKDLQGAVVLVAAYYNEGYEGSSYILYEKEGKLYEDSSGHCSCNGLSWAPDEVTVPYLRNREVPYALEGDDAKEHYRMVVELLESSSPKAVATGLRMMEYSRR